MGGGATTTGGCLLLPLLSQPATHPPTHPPTPFSPFPASLHGMHLQRPSWEAELQPLEGVTGVVEVVVFDMSVRHRIGYRWRNSSSTDTNSGVGEGSVEGSGPLFFCCTKELEPLTGCTVGRLIVRREAHEPDWPRVLEAQFMGNSSLTAELSETVHVPRAGFVYVWLAMCDKNLDNTKVFGHTEWWAHGWGYLPGMLSAHLPLQIGMLVSFFPHFPTFLTPPSRPIPLSPSTPFPCSTLSPPSHVVLLGLPRFPCPLPSTSTPSSFSPGAPSSAQPGSPLLSNPALLPILPLFPTPHIPSQIYTLLYLTWRPHFGPALHSLIVNSPAPIPPPPPPLPSPSSTPSSISPGAPSSAQPGTPSIATHSLTSSPSSSSSRFPLIVPCPLCSPLPPLPLPAPNLPLSCLAAPVWHSQPGTPSLSKHDTPCLHSHPPPPFPPPIPSQLSTLLYFAWRPQFGPAWHSLDRNSLAHFLTFLLLLSLLSSLTTLCDLLLLCTTGHRFVIVTLAAVTVGVLQGLLLRGVLVGVAVGVGTLLPKVGVIPGKALIPAALYVLVAGTCEGMRNVGQVDDWGSGELVALHSPLVLMDLCLAAWLVPTARATEAQHVALRTPLVLMDLCLAAWLVPTARATKEQVRSCSMGGTWARVTATTACGEHVALRSPLVLLNFPFAAQLIRAAAAAAAATK
ncbi:unnamed protein product [Closterium sp. NIES-54]